MSVTAEDVRRRIENARNAGRDEDVVLLENHLKTLKAAPPQEPAVAPALSGQVEKPTQKAPALSQPVPQDDNTRKANKYQEQYDRDQLLERATDDEMRKWRNDHFNVNAPGGSFLSEGNKRRDVVRDPETGNLRWAALPPERIFELEKRGTLLKSMAPALGSGVVRQAGQRVESFDEDIEFRRSVQGYLWDKLPSAEQDRIRGAIATDADRSPGDVTDDMIKVLPAHRLKKYLDQNSDNDQLIESLKGDEESKAFWETAKRIGNRASSVVPGMPLNVFGAEETIGDVSGRGRYMANGEPLDPTADYPGASSDIDDWLSESRKSEGTFGDIYEHIIRPSLTSEAGELPGERITQFAEKIKEKTYTKEQRAGVAKPFFPKDMTWRDMKSSEFWANEETKLPWNDWDAFVLTVMETTPQIAEGMIAARMGGRVGASQAAKSMVGRSLADIEKARRTWGMTGGIVAGGVAEGAMIYDEVASDVRSALTDVSMEKYREDPTFQSMMETGAFTEEEAKQILVADAARTAGETGFWVAGVAAGSPMSAFFGKVGAGRIGGKTTAGRALAGTFGEGLQEGTQEVIEGEISDLTIAKIDPENPIFADKNRRLERFSGGFLIGAGTMVGALGSVEPDTPAGLQNEDKGAMEAAKSYMDAVDGRYSYELTIGDKTYGADHIGRLQDLHKLEQLQKAEAEAIIKNEPVLREYFERNPSQTSKVELKMLKALKMRANSTLTDIAVARTRRQTAKEMVEEQEQILEERARIQRQVTSDLMTLEDIERQTTSIEAVQNNEPVDEVAYEELLKEGYGRWTNNNKDKFVITPKGKRATNLLNQQKRHMTRKLENGYTGQERRSPINQAKRDVVESAGPVEREQMLYTDHLTGAQNRRAFDERTGETQAVAAIDVDSLAWVNDNMSHASGDRLLVAVSDTIGKQKGVEVFRLGGDEFAVTGASEEALETALQAAATELSETVISAGEDQVTPQITWGKGKTYEQADEQAGQMKADRISRGIVASRKKRAATWSHRDQLGLFQKMDGRELFDPETGEAVESGKLPTRWRDIRNTVERGDPIEILTPLAAEVGTVTQIKNRNSKPRLTVSLSGREYTFNPEMNHLITAHSSADDVAWLTGDEEFTDPLYGPLPQVIPTVEIGHVGKGGDWIADLANEEEVAPKSQWWWDEYPEWSMTTPYVMPLPKATQEEIDTAQAVINDITAGYNNLPKINVVTDIAQLKEDSPDVVEQIIAEGGSLTGVRGYMNHLNPEDGVYVFVPNVRRILGSANFEQGVSETILHEMIGHYGIRGAFGDEAELRETMNEVVDAFPRIAKYQSSRLGLNPTKPDHKQLLGEEMIAYIAGEVMSGTITMTKPQQTAWQRFVSWVKNWLTSHGWDRFSTVKKMVTIGDSKEAFWNDERVQALIARSQDFVRNGNGFDWRALTGEHVRFMRDADIFQAGMVSAINTGTRTVKGQERSQLAQKYGGKQNVPKELPLFPEIGSPNIYRTAVREAVKQKLLTTREMTYSGLDESNKDEWALLRDATYQQIWSLTDTANIEWYKDVVPYPIAKELDAIYEARAKAHMIGPMQSTGTVGYGEERYHELANRPILNQVTMDTTQARITEILEMKIDQKKTQLNKDILLTHLKSNKTLRVSVRRTGGHPALSSDQAARRLFGDNYDPDNISVIGKDMIKAEVKATAERGPDVGYDEQNNRWLDWKTNRGSYSEYSPQGTRADNDYRITLITQEGSHEMGPTSHFDPNLMHIRTGVADFLDFEGGPIVADAINPANKNKFLALIELQSDWLQELRKGFSSAEEKEASSSQYRSDAQTLKAVSRNFVSGVSEDLWSMVDEMLKPIANLPTGSLSSLLNDEAAGKYSMAYEAMNDVQKADVYRSVIVSELDKVKQIIMLTRTHLGGITVGNLLDSLPGSMDARAFDRLDEYAARTLVYHLYNDFSALESLIQDDMRYAGNQEQLVDKINAAKSAFLRRTMQYANGSGTAVATVQRLPYAAAALQKHLEPMYETLGLNKSTLSDRISAMSEMKSATVTFPTSALKDFDTATLGSAGFNTLLTDMLSPSSLIGAGIQPNNISFSVMSEVGDHVPVIFTGNKTGLNELSENLTKVVTNYIRDNGSINRAAAIQYAKNNKRAGEMSVMSAAADGIDWNELVNEYNIEEVDVEEPNQEERRLLRDHSVSTFESFEEDTIGDIESDIINEAFNNMDWDDVTNSDGESLSRSESDYRDRLVVDEDGDVDNDDAEEWLENARTEYRTEMYEDDDYRNQAYELVRERWFEDGPTALWIGQIPVGWDEDGDPNDFHELVVKKTDHEDTYDIFIDGSSYDYNGALETTFGVAADQIASHYESLDVIPPRGTLFNPDTGAEEEVEAAAEGEELPQPNWEMLGNNIADFMQTTEGKSEATSKVFERMVRAAKKASGAVMKATPLGQDAVWRTIALKYMLADAVRRGMPGIIWNSGLASAARGGFSGMSGVTSTSNIAWTKETVTLRGEQEDVIVLRSPDFKDIALAPSQMVGALGRDLAVHIYKQISGEIPATVESVVEDADPDQRSPFLISQTESGLRAVHRRSNNNFIGFAADDAALESLIESQEGIVTHVADREVTNIGEVMVEGQITEESFGGKMYVILGDRVSNYEHTFGQPRLAGSRKSYEDITYGIWEKELKKHGASIGKTYIKVNDLHVAVNTEGQRKIASNERADRIKERHGSVSVQELTGETHGWIIVSENHGPVKQTVYMTEDEAKTEMQNWIKYEYGDEKGGIEAYYIEINDAIREEFSGPVAPFHYNPADDPELKDVAEKIGYEGKSFRDVINKWTEAWKDNFNQGMFDRFYGIKRAMYRAGEDKVGAAKHPYIQARLTTSLDSVMKAVLEYGAPIWSDEGIVQTSGRGLLDIMQPVMKNIELWGMYMAGKRSKSLMLEGYNLLDAHDRQMIDDASKSFEGDEKADKIMALIARYDGFKPLTKPVKKRKPLPETKGGVRTIEIERMMRRFMQNPITGSIVRPGGKFTKAKKIGKKLFNNLPRYPTPLWEEMRAAATEKGITIDKDWTEAMKGHVDLVTERIIAEDKDETALNNEEFDEYMTEMSIGDAAPAIVKLIAGGREALFSPKQIAAMIRLGDQFPAFERVSKEYARFNGQVLDFAEESGVINKDTRSLWENADYVPFYRVEDERMVGPFSGGAGVANQKSPIKRLHGGDANVGDITHNIMINLTKLIDTSMKNHASLMAVDSLRGSGIVSKKPMTHSQELIPLQQVKKLLIDRGMNPNTIPTDALAGFQKMFAVQPPSGPGVISVLRDGKKEFYYTDDELLYRSLTSINQKSWGAWMKLFRAPKRLLTTMVTLDPGFMIANFIRDTGSAFVLSRDNYIPIASSIKGFAQALVKDDAMRTMMSAGAAFENGYINQYDPKSTSKLIKKTMQHKSFSRTLLTSPVKLLDAWKAIGAASENANRIAVYNAAINSGKGKAQAAFEAKDLMDFSMHGDWPAVQFLIQTVPFLGARMQGLHRLGRGFVENPMSFAMKGMMIGMAGLALWFQYRDDERYEELEEWDKDTYFHWWIGDNHYRLPKPFEVGAIFNTIPERMMEFMYSKETDKGKHLMKRFGFMLAETFNANPTPQTLRPLFESYFNYNFFTGRDIVSPYMEERMAPEEYRSTTSPTMIELARALPAEMDTASGKVRSPLHLENLYRGYTGTLGRYFLMASDAVVRDQMDYPNPPTFRTGDWPVTGRFFRGDEPRRTKYEEEVYNLLRKTTEIQGSLRFLEKTKQRPRYDEIKDEWKPYIRVGEKLEEVRSEISELNKAIMLQQLSEKKTPEEKRERIDKLQKKKNALFERGYRLRPGAKEQRGSTGPTEEEVTFLINEFGEDDVVAKQLEGRSPETFDLVTSINTLGMRDLQMLARQGMGEK